MALATTRKSTSAAKRSSGVRKSHTVTLPNADPKKNSVLFKASGQNPLVRSVYVRNSALDKLNETGKPLMLGTFQPHEVQPKNSYRFDESGEDIAIGGLYIMREPADKADINADNPVKVKLELAGEGVKLTISKA